MYWWLVTEVSHVFRKTNNTLLTSPLGHPFFSEVFEEIHPIKTKEECKYLL